MYVSRLDKIYRKILLTKFFNKGWGNPEHILKLFQFRKVISNRNKCIRLIPDNYPITILDQQQHSDCTIIQGKFGTPLARYLPDVVIPEVRDAYFEMIIPLKWKSNFYRPLCIHLAGTGDHYFWKRRNVMAKPLLKDGIAAILLENPFYGLRKPKDQYRSSLHNVSDIFVMGGCLVLECLVLLKWCEALGFGPLGISGISMGGHMASLAATNWPKPLVLVPCLSSSTASAVFTEIFVEHIYGLLRNENTLQLRLLLKNAVKLNKTASACIIMDQAISNCAQLKIENWKVMETPSSVLKNKCTSNLTILTECPGNFKKSVTLKNGERHFT